MLVEELRCIIPANTQIQIRNKQGYLLVFGENGSAETAYDKVPVKAMCPVTSFDPSLLKILPVIQIEV